MKHRILIEFDSNYKYVPKYLINLIGILLRRFMRCGGIKNNFVVERLPGNLQEGVDYEVLRFGNELILVLKDDTVEVIETKIKATSQANNINNQQPDSVESEAIDRKELL